MTKISIILISMLLLTEFSWARSQFEQCNWLVTYRNRTYDLSPLTRESLSRPIEGDIRSILQRVPSAEEHLRLVDKNVRDAKAYTYIATAGVTAFVATRIIRPNIKSTDTNARFDIDVMALVSGLIFLKSAHESYRSSRQAKKELAFALDEFNANSPQPIEPIKGSP